MNYLIKCIGTCESFIILPYISSNANAANVRKFDVCIRICILYAGNQISIYLVINIRYPGILGA